MGSLVFTNELLLQRAQGLRSLLNTAHFLKLVAADFTLTPALIYTDLFFATFPGYGPIDLTDWFLSPVKVKDGEYRLPAALFTFKCTGASSQTIYGWAVTQEFSLHIVGKFVPPIDVNTGTTISFQLVPEVWNRSTT